MPFEGVRFEFCWGFLGFCFYFVSLCAEPPSEWPQAPATVTVQRYVIIRAGPPCSEVCNSCRAVVDALSMGCPVCPLCSGQDTFSLLFERGQVSEDLFTCLLLNTNVFETEDIGTPKPSL